MGSVGRSSILSIIYYNISIAAFEEGKEIFFEKTLSVYKDNKGVCYERRKRKHR